MIVSDRTAFILALLNSMGYKVNMYLKKSFIQFNQYVKIV